MSDRPENEAPAPAEKPVPKRSRKYLALFIGVLALVLLAYFSQPYLKLLGPPERCWEVQEIDGRLYRVNPCTGQFHLIGEIDPGRK